MRLSFQHGGTLLIYNAVTWHWNYQADTDLVDQNNTRMVLIIWLCLYLLAVHSQLRWLDLVAFCGYKYVGMIASVGCGLLGGAYVYYGVLGYSALAIAYFLVSVHAWFLVREWFV